MLTYREIIELRDKVACEEIDLESAQALYCKDYKEGQRSWETKDWKERRSKVIKEKCEICGSKGTLTLQHLSHPRKYADYLREITRVSTKEYKVLNPNVDKHEYRNYIISKYEYIPVPFCPNCKWNNPYERVKKVPKYRCTGCKHEFDTPVYYSIDELISIFLNDEEALEVRDKCFVSKDKWRNKQSLSSIKYWMQRESVKSKNAESIEKKAFLLYLDDCIKYLSFEDTITACKKCAYSFDVKKLDLCPICGQYYKGFQYPTCIQCLPEDKRKAALANIELGKMFHDMHNDLGID